MKRRKNVSKQEVADSIKISLEHNAKALDYIENVLNNAKDNLRYSPRNLDYKENVTTLEYIKTTLLYLDAQYLDGLKKVGGFNYGFNK